MIKYFIGFLITIGLIVLVIILLFSGGGSNTPPKANHTLVSYANTDATATFTLVGPITSQQNHNAIRIIVGRDDVTYQQIQGYDGNVVNSQTFANTENAYNNFLYSLSRAGFTQGDTSSSLSNQLGYCPSGQQFIFDFNQDGRQLQHFWATSCGGTKTFKGNLNLNIALFEAQVPKFSNLTDNVDLNSFGD